MTELLSNEIEMAFNKIIFSEKELYSMKMVNEINADRVYSMGNVDDEDMCLEFVDEDLCYAVENNKFSHVEYLLNESGMPFNIKEALKVANTERMTNYLLQFDCE